jgi:hypothetical protein
MRDSLRPPNPFILLWAAIAERRSKKSKMIFERDSLSTLRGMNVLNESLAMCESAPRVSSVHMCAHSPGRGIPCSPTLKSSYESQPTTPPCNLLQHHLTTPEITYYRR